MTMDVLSRERHAQRMTARITDRGVRLDPDTLTALRERHTAEQAEAAAFIRAMGVENPGSGQQVAAKALELGAELPRTPTGKPSVPKDVLERDAKAESPLGPFMGQVLAYRHHETALGLFVAPYTERVERGDGRARPTIYTLGTDTGRMCLPVEHGLVTPDGHVKAEDVREGMRTLDAAGRWVRVLAVHRYDDQPVQTLSNRGIELAGTPEHRWVTTRDHEAAYAVRNGRPAPPRVLRCWDDHPRLRVHLAPEVEPFDFDARTIPAETDGQRFAALVGMLVTDGRCVETDVPEVGMRAYVYQTEAKFHAEFRRVIPEDAVMYDRVTASGDAHHEIRIAARWLRPRLSDAGLRVGPKLKESPDLYRWAAELSLDELRAFLAACWLADGSLTNNKLSCGSENLRAVLTLAAYRLGYVAYEDEQPPSEWSTKPRLMLRFREPVITTRKSVRSEGRGDVWCVTTESGTFTAVGPRGTVYLTGNSATRPNIQQLPREGGVRSCITADPGDMLISADFSGVELRVAAALSGDQGLKNIITEEAAFDAEVAARAAAMGDTSDGGKKVARKALLAERGWENAGQGDGLHWIIARQIWGAEATKAHRYVAKRIVFGRIYGGGLTTLAAQVGVSAEVGQQVIDTLDQITPTLAAWSRGLSDAVRRGMTQFPTYAGRVIHMPPETPHKAPNYAIQGSARELLVDALIRWAGTPWGTATLWPVHDELVIAVPEQDAHAATDMLCQCMAGEVQGVPIVADPSEPSFAWADST